MGIVELRLSMLATLTIIIGLSTLVLTGVMLYFGVFNIIAVGIIVVAINIAAMALRAVLTRLRLQD